MEPDISHCSTMLKDGSIHPRFGDLRRHDSVNMTNGHNATGYDFTAKEFTYIHLSVTGRCYARCKGCINSSITAPFSKEKKEKSPIEETVPARDAACILNLLKEEVHGEAAVCFYGGEPLMATEKLARVIEILSAAEKPFPIHYMLYTNGDLLGAAIGKFPQLMERMWLTSVSIDGRKTQHETVRPGTNLDKIHAGLVKLNNLRRGKVLMWSTLRESQSLADCFHEFLDLQKQGLADIFFWHWVETAAAYEDFPSYLLRYENDLIEIMDQYIAWLSMGKVLPIIHINELVIFLLSGISRNSSACGVELAGNFDLINGKIQSCADLPLEMAIGEISPDGTPLLNKKDLSHLVSYKEDLDCKHCGVHAYCGGRCPVQAHISEPERLLQYCQLMRLHVGVVLEFIPTIMEKLRTQGLSAQVLYDEAAFYAQFTDVTP